MRTYDTVCCCKEEMPVNEQLKALYDSFYKAPPAAKLKNEIEACHQELIERLEKPERKLVLQIIDCKDQIAEDLSIDSFISGFRLAWQLANELNTYEKMRPLPTRETVGVGASSMSGEQT